LFCSTHPLILWYPFTTNPAPDDIGFTILDFRFWILDFVFFAHLRGKDNVTKHEGFRYVFVLFVVIDKDQRWKRLAA
jgi:hypothetical protein